MCCVVLVDVSDNSVYFKGNSFNFFTEKFIHQIVIVLLYK